LVEYRDEVYARLAGDMSAMGIWVERAASAAEATQTCAHSPPDLMIANVEMPDESGWLLAGKLRFVWPTACIWLYTPRPSGYEQGLAHFLGVAEVVHYDGNLFWLAEEIRRRLTRPPARDVDFATRGVA
jgi:DNA-binding response OmpR family regulator